jgi:hypothetical protein
MTPEQMLKNTDAYLKNLEKAKRGHVAVGLPSEEVGGTVYDDGQTVVQVGAQHEYGAGVPRRSFLRTPFDIKKDDLDKAIAKQFADVFERGKSAEQALGLIGTVAVNISKGAFTTRGYGEWPDITQATKDGKGSSQVLIDTGILRGSITYVVRGL